MGSVEKQRERVKNWIQTNRLGSQAELPVLWTIYALNTAHGKIDKNSAPVGNNTDETDLENGELERSLDLLFQAMSAHEYTKYYAVRLRSRKNDTGLLCNFSNPYYTGSGIAGTKSQPQQQQQSPSMDNSIMMFMMQQMVQAQQNSTNLMMQMMQDGRNTAVEMAKLQISSSNEIAQIKNDHTIQGLKKEVEAARESGKSTVEVLVEHLPTALDAIEAIQDRFGNKGNQVSEQPSNQSDQTGITQILANDQHADLLPKALELLAQCYSTPSGLIYKIAWWLRHADADQRGQFAQRWDKRYALKLEEVQKSEQQ